MTRVPTFPRLPRYRVAIALVVLAGAVGAGLVFRDQRAAELAQARANFIRRAAVLHARLTDLLGRYDDALVSLRAAMIAGGGANRVEFDHIAAGLAARNPGAQAFEWVPIVPAAERATVEAALARDYGLPLTVIDRTADGSFTRAAAQPDYLPIRYAYPVAGNEPVLGYNLRSGPTLDAIERARASGQLALSRQIVLAQDRGHRRGVVMVLPVYRPGPQGDVLAGYVQGVFRLHDMLEAMRTRTWGPGSILDVLFLDDSEPDAAYRTMYYRPFEDTAPRTPVPSPDEFRQGMSYEMPLPFGGREWRILYRPYPGWVSEQLGSAPWFPTISVLVVAALVAGFVEVLGRRAKHIAREVAERTMELSESRRQLSNLLHSLPGMAYRCEYEQELRVLYISVGVQAITGYPPEDFTLGRVHFRDLVHPGDVARVRAATLACLREGTELEVEYRLRARDGTERWLLSRARCVQIDDGRPRFIEGLAVDITPGKRAEAEKLRLERRMLESQKLESLGLLAGGVAHDFNNILTGILGNAGLARMKIPADSPLLANVRRIETGAARAAELCQQMLSYSGRGSLVVEPVDVSHLVQDTLPLLHVTITGRARLQLELSPEPAVAVADATQIRQIVMNLVLNAADAVGDQGGEIVVRTGRRPFDRAFLAAAADGAELPAGDYVFIAVTDNGCGMTPETLARIFDPFFTTKFAGRGLGLAAVRGIVRGHQGAIHVASRAREGSTFTLLLPPSAQASAQAAAAPVEERHYHGTVLVIDDEEAVREAASDLLQTFGFTTVTVSNGAQGLAEFARRPAEFKFVLLDLTMPELSGEETLTALRSLQPGVRVLLVSGYSDSARIAQLARAGVVQFLQKPFTRDDLARRLSALLG
ncbi:MAG TPA: CHASE domain-containing protein [Opitutaceae bacterium]|nr:CHASE domain-containing protein [Opitutaceae bacterium]HND62566.1 CHASE domain-containing protein [Opitutaceae bacterium]